MLEILAKTRKKYDISIREGAEIAEEKADRKKFQNGNNVKSFKD